MPSGALYACTVSTCANASSLFPPQDLAQNASLPIANFAGPSRACPGTRYSARIGGPLRVFFSAVYALSAPRTCTSRRPVKLAFSLRDVLLYVGAAGFKLPAARSIRTIASSPLDPPIDDALIFCVERAQEGWDAQYSTDESARPSPSRCTPWSARTVTSPTSRALSTSHSTLFFPPSSLISAVIITPKRIPTANDVQPQQDALRTRVPTETSKPAHALVLTYMDLARTKKGLFQETGCSR
ncbi:hypothetical protein EV122DRAFT_280279 [Schizophyllum commune]